MSLEDRAQALAALLAKEGLDALVVGDLVRPGDSPPDARANVRWLTGFTGTSGFAIVGGERREFLTDFRYESQSAREVADGFERVTLEGKLIASLAKRLRGRVGFDDATTSVRALRQLEGAVGDAVELVATSGLVERLRRSKDADEVAAIAAAARLGDEIFELIAGAGLVGRTERDVVRAAEARMRESGAEPAFPTIVASGPNGALPHAVPGAREIQAGELVVVDLGVQLDGYCSDGTRTFATGEVDDEERAAYGVVLGAQEAALAALRPGLSGAAADAAAREPIAAAGYGERFGHGLGHGVGLEVHEAPRLGKTSEDVLVPGDVVTVEPGVYLPDRFGIRIEDLVVVTDEGIRNLSSTPKELRIV